MRFAYADPVYLGCSRLYPEHPESYVWDDLVIELALALDARWLELGSCETDPEHVGDLLDRFVAAVDLVRKERADGIEYRPCRVCGTPVEQEEGCLPNVCGRCLAEGRDV